MNIPLEYPNLLMLNMGCAHHNGNWNWKNVMSPFTRIFLVTEGKAKVIMPDGCVELTPNHLYIIPAGTLHSYECEGVFTHYYMHVYEELKNETDLFDFYKLPTEVEATETDLVLMKTLCLQHPEARLPGSDPTTYDNETTLDINVRRYISMPLHEKLFVRGCITVLFSRFMTTAQPRNWTYDKRLTRVMQHINNNIYSDISIDELADVACVTKHYLIKIFKRSFGLSPLKYINRKKMERAQLMLITDKCSVKEISFALGYSSPTYFCRLFRQITGRSPQDYREGL